MTPAPATSASAIGGAARREQQPRSFTSGLRGGRASAQQQRGEHGAEHEESPVRCRRPRWRSRPAAPACARPARHDRRRTDVEHGAREQRRSRRGRAAPKTSAAIVPAHSAAIDAADPSAAERRPRQRARLRRARRSDDQDQPAPVARAGRRPAAPRPARTAIDDESRATPAASPAADAGGERRCRRGACCAPSARGTPPRRASSMSVTAGPRLPRFGLEETPPAQSSLRSARQARRRPPEPPRCAPPASRGRGRTGPRCPGRRPSQREQTQHQQRPGSSGPISALSAISPAIAACSPTAAAARRAVARLQEQRRACSRGAKRQRSDGRVDARPARACIARPHSRRAPGQQPDDEVEERARGRAAGRSRRAPQRARGRGAGAGGGDGSQRRAPRARGRRRSGGRGAGAAVPPMLAGLLLPAGFEQALARRAG